MIRLGADTAAGIKVGSQAADKIYVGSDVLYSSAVALAAWERVYNQAVIDDWRVLYDPTNPNTRQTVGSSVEGVSDALGFRVPILQPTATAQPTLVPNHFGQLDALYHGDDTIARWLYNSNAADWLDVSAPWTKIGLLQIAGGGVTQIYFGANYCGLVNNTWTFSGGGSISSGSARDYIPHVFTGVHQRDGRNDYLYLDNALLASRVGSSTATAENNWIVGSNHISGSNAAKGYTGLSMIRADTDIGAVTRMQDLLHEVTTIPKVV